jgi:CO dehydrogenase/acetyl-CoA synthase alpha subunit
LSKDRQNKQPKKLKGIVAEENSDPKTLKEALIKVLEEQGITVIRNK